MQLVELYTEKSRLPLAFHRGLYLLEKSYLGFMPANI